MATHWQNVLMIAVFCLLYGIGVVPFLVMVTLFLADLCQLFDVRKDSKNKVKIVLDVAHVILTLLCGLLIAHDRPNFWYSVSAVAGTCLVAFASYRLRWRSVISGMIDNWKLHRVLELFEKEFVNRRPGIVSVTVAWDSPPGERALIVGAESKAAFDTLPNPYYDIPLRFQLTEVVDFLPRYERVKEE